MYKNHCNVTSMPDVVPLVRFHDAFSFTGMRFPIIHSMLPVLAQLWTHPDGENIQRLSERLACLGPPLNPSVRYCLDVRGV